MPTYEYVCTTCGAPIEVVQSIHEPALTDCPSCSDGRLRKVFGNVGVVFKGSGFYRTDSRSKSTSTPQRSGRSQATKSGDSATSPPSTAAAKESSASGSGSGTSSSGGSSTPTSSSSAASSGS